MWYPQSQARVWSAPVAVRCFLWKEAKRFWQRFRLWVEITDRSLYFLMMLRLDLRKKFANIHKEHSPSSRVFYCHFTSVTVSEVATLYLIRSIVPQKDVKSTRLILANGGYFCHFLIYCYSSWALSVQDTLIRQSLKESALLVWSTEEHSRYSVNAVSELLFVPL